MPKYDAFGREIGNDPLKSLKENTNSVPAERPRVDVSTREPVVAADAEPVFVPPQFSRPRRRRGFGLAGLLVLGAGIGAIALVADSAVEKGQDLIENAIPEFPDAEPDAPPPPVGLEADSLIRESNFSEAMETLAASGKGRPILVRIAPERIDADLIEGSTIHIVQITPDGNLRELGSSQGNGRPIAYKAIDPAAPERMVRRAATPKSPPRNINYLVLSPGPPQTLGAYFKSGRIVIGDAHGRPQRVL